MALGGKRGAGERVLESRHVIGLFLLMLLFSGVFFTLGYVMGRNQYDGQVRAAATSSGIDGIVAKQNQAAKRSPDKTPPAAAPTDAPAPNSDWEFYNAGKHKTTEDHLKPAESVSHKAVPAVAKSDAPARTVSASSKSAPSISAGSYTLQVAALSKEPDAMDLASRLQAKKFPVFVLSPHGDKYYRVLVGPYADQKSADTAKKGLEAAGFKAFVKH